MKEFKFEEKGHIYTLDGKPLTGVTTVLSIIGGSKSQALIQWSANMAVEYIANNIDKVFTYPLDKNKIDEFLNEAKTAHRRKKEDAGQQGTDVHAEIEEIVKYAIKVTDGKVRLIDYKNKQVNNFVKWAVDNDVTFLESEKKMYSEKHWLAGTCDFTCIIDGKKYVGDTKTTSGIYGREPFMQTAAYRMMLEEMGEKDFEGSIIVNIKKTGVFDENNDVHFSPYYEDDLRGFLSALELYRVINSFEKPNYKNNNKKTIRI